MKALRFHAFGGLDRLALEDVPRPEPRPGEILVAVRAASVNPSDAKNVAGTMESTTLPRVPGRDFSGVVVSGAPGLDGVEVWGAGGEVGFTRDGTHAEYVVLPVDGVARKPVSLDFAEAAACGVNFVTAWAALADAIELGAGETILVTGARGGVGSSAIQLARWMGARTIGVDRSLSDGSVPAWLRPDVALTTADDVPAAVLRETGGHGVHAVFDTVGAPLFAANLASLAHAGRYAIIASVGERRVSFDVLDFYHKSQRLLGVDSRAIRSGDAARKLDRMRPGFESGALRPPAIASRRRIEDGRDAYASVASGSRGKVVFEFPGEPVPRV